MTDAALMLDFFGARMLVCGDRKWLGPVRATFADFVADDPRLAAGFNVKIQEIANTHIEHGLPLTYEGPMADGNHCRIYESESRVVIEVPDGGVTVIDHAGRRAEAQLLPGSQSKFFGSVFMTIIDAALVAGGQQLTHAASLVDARSGKAILFCVPSGGGKTTTSLALAHDGFSLMSDDASVLVPDQDGFQVWGMPRALKVHVKTADLLPWVGPLEAIWDENGEQGVELHTLRGRIGIAPVKPAPLGAIVLIGPRSQAGNVVKPAAKPDILVALAHDNVAFRAAGMTPKAMRSYGVYARAVANVPTFELNAGTDLDALPLVLMEALA
jgi:hypothetical protein